MTKRPSEIDFSRWDLDRAISFLKFLYLFRKIGFTSNLIQSQGTDTGQIVPTACSIIRSFKILNTKIISEINI